MAFSIVFIMPSMLLASCRIFCENRITNQNSASNTDTFGDIAHAPFVCSSFPLLLAYGYEMVLMLACV